MSADSHRREPGGSFSATSLELFFDLVFVFAVTQVSHLLIDSLTWQGALHATIAFMVVWWSWQYTVWVTNELDPDVIRTRMLLLLLMLASLLMAIAIPEAFGDRALLFAGSYVFIQVARHGYLTFVTAGPGTVERRRSFHILSWFCLSGCFWIAGAFLDGDARILTWLLALAIDLIAPRVAYWLPFSKMDLSAWKVGADHFVERFQAFTIIALGETVVLTGAAAAGLELDAAVLAATTAAFVSTAALWWLYFNSVATVFERLLAGSEARTALARDLFTYGHIPIVAGIVLCAVGDELVLHGHAETLSLPVTVGLAAGPVLYLLAFVPARWRIDRSLPRWRLGGAAASVVIAAVAYAAGAPTLVLGLLLTGVLLVVVAGEFRLPLRILDRDSA